MKITFLGTGAALCIRVPESEMTNDKRRCAATLIDENIMIDMSFQSVDFAKKLGKDMSKITDVFLTHSHADHFQKHVLMSLAEETEAKLNFWCHKNAVENLGLDESELEKINLHTVDVLDKWETGGVAVTALSANHLTQGNEQPLHYIFEKDGKKLFFGCDGGWFTALTWEYLRKQKLDAVILDATVGDDAGNFRIGTHNSIPMLKIINAALTQNNIMDENAPRIANHIADSVYKMSKGEVKAALAEIGMIATDDGLEIEI